MMGIAALTPPYALRRGNPVHHLQASRGLVATLASATLLCMFITDASCSGKSPDEIKTGSFPDPSSEMEKIISAIRIIEKNKFGRYSRLIEFDNAFGTNFDEDRKRHSKPAPSVAVINFSKQAPSSSDEYAADYSGWYLVPKHDANGKVIDYFITNVHK